MNKSSDIPVPVLASVSSETRPRYTIAAVPGRQTQDASFQAPSRVAGRNTPTTIRLTRREQQTPPSIATGTGTPVGSPATPCAPASSPVRKLDASFSINGQEPASSASQPDIPTTTSKTVAPLTVPKATVPSLSSSPATASMRKLGTTTLIRPEEGDDTIASDPSVSSQGAQQTENGSEESEPEYAPSRPSPAVRRTYGGRPRGRPARRPAAVRKSHRASTGADPLRVDATFDGFQSFADAAMARLAEGGHRFRIVQDPGCWVKFYCANGKATAVPNKHGYIEAKEYVIKKGSALPEKRGAPDKGCVAAIAARHDPDDSWTVVQYKNDHALECLIEDAKWKFEDVDVELPTIGERKADSDDEVKEIAAAKAADIDLPVPSDNVDDVDETFDAMIDGDPRKRRRDSVGSDISSTPSVIGNGLISDDTENEDQARRRLSSSTHKNSSSLPARRATSESKSVPKSTRGRPRKRPTLPLSRAIVTTVPSAASHRKPVKVVSRPNGISASKGKVKRTTPLKALNLTDVGIAFFKFAGLETLGDVIDEKLLPEEVLSFITKMLPVYKDEQKKAGSQSAHDVSKDGYSYVARFHDSEEITKALEAL